MGRNSGQKWNILHVRGLRQQWLVNTAAPILAVLILIVALFFISVTRYYYSGMRNDMEHQLQTHASAFLDYFMDGSFSSYLQKANQATTNFENKDRLELQFISANGRIQVSSASNLTVGTAPRTQDIVDALQSGEAADFRGENPETGERILAMSYPLTVNGQTVGLMRLVTSLREADRQIMWAIGLIGLLAVMCMLLTIFSNLLFINQVVEPVAVVTDAARRIAAGSYGFTIDRKYKGELADLVDGINDMSMQIGRNEKLKTEFIASVSHELRTPLTAIHGWGETILTDETGDKEQVHRGMRIILNEVRRLSAMVEELLDFSKMEDGRFTLHMEEVDLQAELEDAVFTYRELFRQEGISLEYEAGEDLLPPVSGDPERLKQVFCNVLDNAAKHGGSGKRIAVSMTREKKTQVIRIRDYGPGIPEAELPFVKQKFYKGSSKARGSGIGLAVCDEIVHLHGGSLAIYNAEGGGTEVCIVLPEP